MSGRVVHFELPADDVDRAQTFYREAFGWAVNSAPGMGYTLLGTTPSDSNGVPTEPGGINGGMLLRQSPISHPVITVQVDDIDQALQRIEELGGKAVRGKESVGPIGFAAYFADSEGNVVGLWQAAR